VSPAAAEPVREDQRVILAIGGHEFSRKQGNEAIRDYMLALAEGPEPRVCLLPTASGDPAEQIAAFRSHLGELPCRLSHLSLFRLESEGIGDLRGHLLGQDLIYVGGGSMINLLAIWRAHGLDEVLRSCWERGVALAGQSAGAMCWFDWGVTRSAGQARVVAGLGLLPGITSVHYHRDPDRRRALLDAVGARGEAGYGIDDRAGLLFRGRRLALALTGQELARAWLVHPSKTGEAREAPMDCVALPAPRPAIDETGADVTELRRLRALRAGRGHRLARFR
jgi:dipeptidase E